VFVSKVNKLFHYGVYMLFSIAGFRINLFITTGAASLQSFN